MMIILHRNISYNYKNTVKKSYYEAKRIAFLSLFSKKTKEKKFMNIIKFS